MTAALATLNPAAQVALVAAEQRIERGLKSFLDVGSALAEIRDSRLYRLTHATFEDYCRERWNLSRPRAYEMIGAAEVVSGMPDIGIQVTNARQANALSAVSTADRADVLREAADRSKGGKPTAKAIAEVAKERTAPETPAPADPPSTASAGAGSTSPEPARRLSVVPDPTPRPSADPELEAQLAADSTRRAAIRNLTSVLTFLKPLAITPAELAEREYGPVLDAFEQEDLDRAAETMAAIAAMKRGM